MQPFKGNSVCCVRLRKEKKKNKKQMRNDRICAERIYKILKTQKSGMGLRYQDMQSRFTNMLFNYRLNIKVSFILVYMSWI